MQTGSRRRRQRIDGDETDAFGSWRHLVRWRPGERPSIKRRARRRERHEAREDIDERQQDAQS